MSPTPQPVDQSVQDASRNAAIANQQAKKKQGFQSTMLTGGGSAGSAAATRKTSMLGGSPM